MRDPLLIHAMSEALKKDSPDIDEYKVVKTMVDSDFCETISAETRQNLFNFIIEKITIWPVTMCRWWRSMSSCLKTRYGSLTQICKPMK